MAAGVEGVDRNLISMSRSYGLKTQTAMRHIVIPSLAPFLFAGSRASFAASWKLAALAETFGGTTGVGVQIRAVAWRRALLRVAEAEEGTSAWST